ASRCWATANANVVLPAPGVAVTRKSLASESRYCASAACCQGRSLPPPGAVAPFAADTRRPLPRTLEITNRQVRDRAAVTATGRQRRSGPRRDETRRVSRLRHRLAPASRRPVRVADAGHIFVADRVSASRQDAGQACWPGGHPPCRLRGAAGAAYRCEPRGAIGGTGHRRQPRAASYPQGLCVRRPRNTAVALPGHRG